MIGRISGIVIECPDPSALAGFYEALLGASRAREAAGWVRVDLGGGQPTVTLQRSDTHRAPDWSSGEPPQQLHLDLLVENLDEAEKTVVALGGRLLEGSDKPIGFRVYADPVRHPFCLVTPEGLGADSRAAVPPRLTSTCFPCR